MLGYYRISNSGDDESEDYVWPDTVSRDNKNLLKLKNSKGKDDWIIV